VTFRAVITYSGVVLAFAAVGVLLSIRELTTPAIIVPIGLTPCLGGVAFAMIACGPLGLRVGAILLRLIATAITVSALAVMFAIPVLGILELLVGMLCLASVGVPPMTSRRAAAVTTACGAVGAIWFLTTAAASRFVWPGASLFAAGASVGLVAGGVLWLAAPVAMPLPRAIARFEPRAGAR
jgi:hypothetical protein